ncbi:hypothetical protein N7516_006696 [Penicillium verrucosum]|uniref:uncharacterized protein n=1 Tax=Penicillium verrucosum TaxID=60171 RepID=UPI0025458930|nr:uncharacterized protein N7516_006696 [Penicillium verrucosum]KAJ5932207.1 hypothetical protein N7516_006696 [Penicillium verrucosum]
MFLCDAGFLEKKPNALGITGKELVINLAQSSISLLNRHLETARPLQISPLMSWFALRCQQCSDIVYFDPNSEERRALETRLCPYLQNLEDEMESLQRSVNMRPARAENHRMDPACNSHQILEELEVQPENSIIATAKPIPAISTFQSLPGFTLADNAGFDALFEEMVTSIPINREQPLFAQNLGFYTGNLDKDFLEALQQPSEG